MQWNILELIREGVIFSAIGNIQRPKDHLTKISRLQSSINTTPNKIKASQMIADTGDSEESSINLFSLDINLLTGELNETEIIRNKKTNVKSMSNNFQALCKREDR